MAVHPFDEMYGPGARDEISAALLGTFGAGDDLGVEIKRQNTAAFLESVTSEIARRRGVPPPAGAPSAP